MTKLIVPQIGDIVRGQVVTEAAHKLWVDLVEKVDALESVATDDLTDELATLGDRIDAVIETEENRPKIEVIASSDLTISLSQDGFDLFRVICEVEYTTDNVSATFINLETYDSGDVRKSLHTLTYPALSPTLVTGTIEGYFTSNQLDSNDVSYLKVSGVAGGSTITVTPTRWIIHKYKSEY